MAEVHVAAVVLAAGRATRFGGTKQLAVVDGRPLVRHAVDTARDAGCAPVLVVVGHDADAVAAAAGSGVEVVPNPAFAEGQASSLRAGVAAATATDAVAMVVLLADQPGITVDAVRAVVAAHLDGAPVARAAYDDRPGHPVVFGRHLWPRLAEVTGDVGARGLLTGPEVARVAVAGPCPPDVDTPGDLPG